MSSSAYNHKTSKNNITFHLTIETASQESLIEMPNEMAILNNSHGKNDDKPWITQQTLQPSGQEDSPFLLRLDVAVTEKTVGPAQLPRETASALLIRSGYEEP